MYRIRRLLSKAECLLVDEPEERDPFLAALFLFMGCFALAILLLSLYEGGRVRRPRSPGPGADVPRVGGPLRIADGLAQDHAVGAGGARSESRRGPRADRL